MKTEVWDDSGRITVCRGCMVSVPLLLLYREGKHPELLRWKSEVEASWDPGQDNSLVSRDDYMIMQGAQCMCVRMGESGCGGHRPGLG